MPNLFARKLEQFVRFSAADRRRLDALAGKRHKTYQTGETIMREGEKPEFVRLVISGLAARYKLLSEGRRQITAFLIPGDLCDVEVFVLEAVDHDIVAMMPTVCAHFIVDHGSRSARERICHLLYELLVRYRVVGLTDNHSFPFPLTQEQLADATGMTPVHVNRVISELKAEGLIKWKDKSISILDLPALKEIAQFEGAYLHLDRTFQGDAEVSARAGDLL
jgi:CRP-like cAMP-binding protein